MRKCCDCKKEKSIDEFQKGVWRCKVCTWIKENSNKLININTPFEKYYIILDNIINLKIKYVNELVNIVDINLEDLIHLLNNNLKIGNKPIKILFNCEQCREEVLIHPCKFILNKNIFCSHKCYSIHKKENMVRGEGNPSYKRIKTKCTNCENEISVIPFNYNKLNSHGDNHNFCSYECYWEYRKKYYIEEKASMYGFKYSDEQIDKMRISTVKAYEKGVFNRETKPQKKVNEMLNNLQIQYQREKGFKYYSVDNYLINYNLIIEVMGDYFHSNPNKYDDITKVNKIQCNGIRRDKSKRTYITKYYNIKMLYLWEFDVNKNNELCKKLISQYIKNSGELENYNSFNYHLDEFGELQLNKKIISPYFELSNKNP